MPRIKLKSNILYLVLFAGDFFVFVGTLIYHFLRALIKKIENVALFE